MDTKKKIRRSRNGCHNCKRLKIKCDENKPSCSYCLKTKTDCDYSIKLTWGGRPYKDASKRKKDPYSTPITFNNESTVNQNHQSHQYNFRIKLESDTDHEELVVERIDSEATVLSNSNSYSTFSPYNVSSSESMKRGNDSLEYIQNKSNKRRVIQLVNTSNSPPTVQSPPSFLTPGGDSILSDNEVPRQVHDYGFSDNAIESKISIKQEVDDLDKDSKQILQSTSPFFLENMPDISDGIESLSNALEKITNGGQHFHLQNSGIFNNFVLSNIDVENRENIPSPMKKSTTPMQTLVDPNNNELDEDILSNYSEDIRRIEAYLPRQSPNFLGDVFNSPISHKWIQASSNKITDFDEEEQEPLDSEILSMTIQNSNEQRIITPEELFSTIPPSITPLPEILLQVPFYRNLMHFWVNVAADHLVPAPAHVYTDNPFKILLPQMAMEYPSILTTLLAFSAKLRSNLISSNDTPAIVTDQLLARSCNELLRLLKDKHSATADSTLATVLLLSCYEVFHSKDFDRHRAHTIGARQIIMARRRSLEKNSNDDSSHSSNTGTESDITFFLMRWFVYVDVIGALSATRNSHNYLSIKDDINAYAPAESVATINEIERLEQSVVNPKRDIDHLLGFDVKFLPHFTEIALLIRKTNNFLELNGGDSSTLPVEIITKALECKEKLMKAYEEGERRRQKKLDKIMDYKIQKKKKQTNSNSPPNLTNLIEQDNILRCTNKSFCDMGILNLYRRVLKIPRDSPLVQQLANGIGNTAKDNFASKSPADVCTIFCSFSAGCETLDEDMRQFFHDRFTKLIEMGNVNALKGLQIMTRCWQTGEDWIVASKILDIDIALL